MTVEISQITVADGIASFKLHNLSGEFTPTNGIIRVELYRDAGFTECTLIMHVYSSYFVLFEYATQKVANLKSYIMSNGSISSTYDYAVDGGYYRIFDGGKVAGSGNLLGSGALPEFS
jgi:hypothetical protein